MNKLYLSDPVPKYYKARHRKMPIYPCHLYVGVDDTIHSLALTQIINNEMWVIFKKSELKNLPIITHEATHVVEAVGDYICDPLRGEANAYLTEWVVRTIIDLLKPRRGKK